MADPDSIDRARTPLLTLITEESLDRDYQVVARRRSEEPDREPRGSRGIVVAAAVAVFGLLVAVAAVQTSQNAAESAAGRARLIDRIETRRAAVQDEESRLAQLRETNVAAEEDYRELGEQLSAAELQRSERAAVTGFVAVRGEGVRMSITDPELADETTRVRDTDLVLVANALWAAGAEAIAINGQRLTARSAIRISGDAIEVNSVGVASPYTILAIGDPNRLATALVDSSSGLEFVALASELGFRYDVEDADDLRIPAAPPALGRLRSVDDEAANDGTGPLIHGRDPAQGGKEQ